MNDGQSEAMRARASISLWTLAGCLGLAALFSVALSANPARADYQAGFDAYSTGDYAAALKQWNEAAGAGDAHAEWGLGLLYDLGRGVPVDPAQAAKWYGMAATRGVPAAENNLALLYAEGRGVEKDMSKADELWMQAAKSGHPEAAFNLGLSYYRGEGIPKSYPDAAGWFKAAAQGGSVDGQYALAEMYRIGRGVPKNLSEARKWFTKAANAGNAAAADRLASLPPDANASGAQPPANTESVMNPTPLAEATKTSTGSGAATTGGLNATSQTSVPPATVPASPPTVPSITVPAAGTSTAAVPDAAPSTTATTIPTAQPGGDAGTITVPATSTSTAVVPDTTPGPTAATTPTAQAGADNGTITFPMTGATANTSTAVVPDTASSTSATTTTAAAGTGASAVTFPPASNQPTQGAGNGGTMVVASDNLAGSSNAGSRNGQVAGSDTPTPPGFVVPLGSDVASTTRVAVGGSAPPAAVPDVAPPPKSTGVINLGLPIDAAAGSSASAVGAASAVTVASAPAASESSGGSDVFRAWIGTFKTENDAVIFWGQEVQRFPDLLKPLKLMLRQVDLGAGQGIWYRVLGGPFGTREAADHLCKVIKQRSPADDCRVILN